MTWFFEDQPIEAGDKYHITFDGTYATLFIAACTMEDMGSFRVLFENKNGTDETTGKVTVKPDEKKKKATPETKPEPEPEFKLPKKKASRVIPAKEEPKEEEAPFGKIKLKKSER